jgi:hypothetical protein
MVKVQFQDKLSGAAVRDGTNGKLLLHGDSSAQRLWPGSDICEQSHETLGSSWLGSLDVEPDIKA